MQLLATTIGLLVFSCVNGDMSDRMNVEDIKPGHDMVKEYHMHPYWFLNGPQVFYFDHTFF